MNTATTILDALKDRKIGMIEKDIREAWDILKVRFDELRRAATYSFSIGDNVTFQNRGIRYEGVVEKLNQKTVSVRISSGGTWRVTSSVLTKVAAPAKVAAPEAPSRAPAPTPGSGGW